MLAQATVTERKAVLLGTQVCADGFQPRRRVRVVTHAHSDHTVDLRKSLSYQSHVLMTPETAIFVKHLMSIKTTRKIVIMKPRDKFKVQLNDASGGYETVEFYPAVHIPGSVQVVVETSEGVRVGYTGDFKEPGSRTPILKDLDVLVIDVTYGCPWCTRPYKGSMEEELVKLVFHLLGEGPVHIYAYNGKIQEVMELLRLYGLDAPYLVDQRTFKILKEMEKLGYNFGEYFTLSSEEGKEVERTGWYVRFASFRKFNTERVRGNKVILDGWQFVLTQKIGPNAWRVGFSDHGDLEDIEYYILESRAKAVILDASRSPHAPWLASRLSLYGKSNVSYRPLPQQIVR